MKSSEIHNAIDDFIESKRDIRPNPFMATRIMAMIEDEKIEKVSRPKFVLQAVMIAASIVIVTFSGIALGNNYETKKPIKEQIVINDNNIENFVFYKKLASE